jgi:4-amino-4-deoxy-L-arabinose transferase-like glycosyltransferase
LIRRRPKVAPTVLLLGLGSVAFVHLMALPAFEDEGSQMRWIYRIIQAREWLQPLGDGKPLEAWPMVGFVRWGAPPLLTMRVFHVLAGLLCAWLTYRLALDLTGRGAALAAGILVAICPFTVYLERFALSDVVLCAAGLATLVGVSRFMEHQRGAVAIGACLVLAALAKLPVGFIFLSAAPVALLARHGSAPPLDRAARRKLLAAHMPAVLLALAILLEALRRVQRGLEPGFGLQDLIGIGLGGYRGIEDSLGAPRPTLLRELAVQLTWPVLVAGALGIAGAALAGPWRARWLIAVGLAPMLAIGYLASFWFSRYLLFTIPPLTVCAVAGWSSCAKSRGRWRAAAAAGTFALCAVLLLRQSALLILAPSAAHWSPVDRFQYVEGPESGYGYREAAKFIETAPSPPRRIFSLNGHSAYQLLAYLPREWDDRVAPVFYASDHAALEDPGARLANLERQSAWIIAPVPELEREWHASFGAISHPALEPIALFDKPGARGKLGLYVLTGRRHADPSGE